MKYDGTASPTHTSTVGEAAPPLPNFLVVGAAKAGTTSLFHHLRAHPEVFVSRTKEVHFFDVNHQRGLDWYRSHFVGVEGQRAIGEFSPSYMYGEATVRRMAEAVPDARLVVTLRHPLDRAYSHYWMNRRTGKDSLGFEAALEAEPGRLATMGPEGQVFAYADRSRYMSQLETVCRYYDRDRVHVFLFDDLRADPEGTWVGLCRFLGVDDTVRPPDLGRSFNESVAFRSLYVRRVTHALLARHLRLPARVVGRLNQRRVRYPALDAGTRARLVGMFEEENARLSAWLGRDLSHWNR